MTFSARSRTNRHAAIPHPGMRAAVAGLLLALVSMGASACRSEASSASGGAAPDFVGPSPGMDLALRSSVPESRRGDVPQPVHRRFTVAAPHEGLLMVRVRDPLAKSPTPTWGDCAGSTWLEGVSQRVLDLGFGEASGPSVVEIELRIEHPVTPDENVRVHFDVTRPGAVESWTDFYVATPATRTTRASWSTQDADASVESGSTQRLCTYSFGGEGPVDVPLNAADQQQLVVELGWKSAFDLTR
jgi:hypothetical protein